MLYRLGHRFVTQPSASRLDSLREQFVITNTAWQSIAWFRYGTARVQFGAVDGAKRMDRIHTFPVAVMKLEEYITNNDHSLANTEYDTHGLGTIDYLLYASDRDTLLLDFKNSTGRREYLKAVLLNLKNRAALAKLAWPVERVAYLAARGTDAQSSISMTMADLGAEIEHLTDQKVGIPVGRIQLGYQLPAYPLKVEGYYSGYSSTFLTHNVAALERIWNGNSLLGNGGYGLDDCLRGIGATNLLDSTQRHFSLLHAKLEALPEGRLSDLISTHNTSVKEVYIELRKLTQYLKMDHASALGVMVVPKSGDGD